MAFKVHVGPPQITVHQGQTVLVSELDGQINWPSEKGLYFLDTRMISNWAIYANGEQFELLTGGPLSYYTARIFLTNKLIRTEDGSIMPRTLGLTISRSVGGGLHEDLDITNNSMKPIRFQLEIVIRSDFADIFEVKSGQIVRRGQITTVESVSTSWISASGATVKRHSLRCSRGRPVLSSAVRCHRNSHGSRTCRDASSGTLH